MWDDHEIANDDWMHGAQHHDPAANGDWEERKAAAVQAYLDREAAPAEDKDALAKDESAPAEGRN